jgi:hypothetical protein
LDPQNRAEVVHWIFPLAPKTALKTVLIEQRIREGDDLPHG